MVDKKYKKEVIIDAIVKVFDSVEKYAEHKGKKKQTIYGRIESQTNKFLKELEDDGIFIVTQEYSFEKFNQLENDVNDLKDLLILALKENKDLKENNKKLKKDNEKWRRLFDQGGSLDGFESKMNE